MSKNELASIIEKRRVLRSSCTVMVFCDRFLSFPITTCLHEFPIVVQNYKPAASFFRHGQGDRRTCLDGGSRSSFGLLQTFWPSEGTSHPSLMRKKNFNTKVCKKLVRKLCSLVRRRTNERPNKRTCAQTNRWTCIPNSKSIKNLHTTRLDTRTD